MTLTSAAKIVPLVKPQPCNAHECPVEEWLAFFGHRWNALVLWHLSSGPKRHGELAERLAGVTAKVLTERLAGLERRKLISRSALKTFPRTVVYALTAKGRGAIGVLNGLDSWAARHAAHEFA